MILPKERDPRFITIRRGGTLTDADHRLLALWAAACAEHVLGLFESVAPSDPRPRQAIEQVYPDVARFHLTDFRVRILGQGHGTDATVRVLIQTTDGRRLWTTVGVGQNVIEASWEALSEAYLYGLLHAEAEQGATQEHAQEHTQRLDPADLRRLTSGTAVRT